MQKYYKRQYVKKKSWIILYFIKNLMLYSVKMKIIIKHFWKLLKIYLKKFLICMKINQRLYLLSRILTVNITKIQSWNLYQKFV